MKMHVRRPSSKNMVSYSCLHYDQKLTCFPLFFCIGEAINIQMKLLQSDCHSLKPDIEFLESLSSVVGSKWPRLAVFLALSSADIRAVRNEGKGMSVKKQALLMLHKWASCKEATYGQLFQKLKPISLFTLCQ